MTALKGMTWNHPRGFDCLVAASRVYEAQTGVSVEWSKRSLQAFADHPVEDLATRFDFIVLDHPHVGQIAETGALLPLPENDEPANSLGGSPESYMWEGKRWAYAIDASCQMAVHRPDLGLPLPGTWEDFLEGNSSRFRALTPLLPVDAFDMLMTLAASRGEEDLASSQDRFVSEANGVYSLSVLRTLYRLGPEQALTMNPIRVLETLSETDEFACSPCLFGYVNYAKPEFRKHQLSYFDLPVCKGFSRPRSILGGAGIGVSAGTQDRSAAIDFAQWVASEAVQSGVYLDHEGQPAHRQTWAAKQDDPRYSGFFKGAFHTIDNAWTRPRAPWFLGFVDDVCEIMPDFFRKSPAPEAFLNRINALYRNHIGKD